MFYFDPLLMIVLAPAMLLMVWAQARMQSKFRAGMQVSANITGAAAAQFLLEKAGIHDVGIERVRGNLTDHYDPMHKVLRLSEPVFDGRTASSVGIAAHEAGHAIQHATNYLPLVVRNAAVPAAKFGPVAFMVLLTLGVILAKPGLMWLGVIAFGAVAVFQLVNLPVEFDASNRAKRLLTEFGMVDADGADAVSGVLNAAAWTYVAGTLHTVLQVGYYVLRMGGLGGSDE